ncbi:MAG: hypothetical protein QT11_C0001G0377 [archaeon GW2011_AR20]|nr:MAG: hypothetical protein QT11_C0001G0377 [archaeon GW2011_AR20]AQS28052.1 hypothetical protein [uncultured archaeon]AQS28544.1 hypothetical protein [uncultured archaeon]AQS28654.1 hypothetical protein [uncultured archaeon]
MKTRLTITIDEKILNKFKEICKREGYKISTKVERLIEEFTKRR